MTRALEFTLRGSLWLLFLIAAAHAIFIGFVGLTFGFSLWDSENLSPTLHWIAVIAFPIILFQFVTRFGNSLSRLGLISVGAWVFVIYYVIFYLSGGAILS